MLSHKIAYSDFLIFFCDAGFNSFRVLKFHGDNGPLADEEAESSVRSRLYAKGGIWLRFFGIMA